jgi:preprotein translocase subunit YajC
VLVPQRRQQRTAQQMQDSIDVGDEIVTAGGLYGDVLAIDEAGELEVEIAPGVNVRVARRAVVGVSDDDDEDEDDARSASSSPAERS